MAAPAVNEPTARPVGPVAHLVARFRMARTARVAFVDKAMPGPIRYTVATAWKIGLHTTETTGLPSYEGGAVAPQLTVDVKARATYRHYDYTRYAGKAFKHPPGTPPTNTVRVVQLEVIGFCDDHHKDSSFHVSNWTDGDYAYLASVLAQVSADTGAVLRSTVTWKAYGLGVVPNTSAGTHNGVRLSRAAFAAYSGVLGHEHVPDNDHGDPGNPDMSRLLPQAPPPPQPLPGKDDEVTEFVRFKAPHPKAGALYTTNLLERRGVVSAVYRDHMREAPQSLAYPPVHEFTTDSGMNAYAGHLKPNPDGTSTDYNPTTKEWETH